MRPAFQLSIARLQCSACGAEANASCNCGKPYIPALRRAKEIAEANPDLSVRKLAEVAHVGRGTAHRAKGVPDGTGEARQEDNQYDNMSVHYSSVTDEWSTPQDLFDEINSEFKFNLDVCALPQSAKCERYFTPDDDGLKQEWSGIVWMNPPYGDVIGQWVEKAKYSAEKGATVVCLVPARVDTNWWWDNCRFGEIRFLRGRLKFGGSPNSAPFPSAVVIFGRPASVIWWER